MFISLNDSQDSMVQIKHICYIRKSNRTCIYIINTNGTQYSSEFYREDMRDKECARLKTALQSLTFDEPTEYV